MYNNCKKTILLEVYWVLVDGKETCLNLLQDFWEEQSLNKSLLCNIKIITVRISIQTL